MEKDVIMKNQGNIIIFNYKNNVLGFNTDSNLNWNDERSYEEFRGGC